MRARAFWTLYVGITVLIVLIQVEGRPGKSPAGKTVVTKDRNRGKGQRGLVVRRKMTAEERLRLAEKLGKDVNDLDDNYNNSEDYKNNDYVEPCVGVCQYHREIKWKRDNGITDPPVPSTTTEDPASRTTKDYGRHAKEIGRGSAVPGVWPGRSPGTYLALIGSVVSATFSSFVIECTVSQQLYYSGGGKWAPSLNPL